MENLMLKLRQAGRTLWSWDQARPAGVKDLDFSGAPLNLSACLTARPKDARSASFS